MHQNRNRLVVPFIILCLITAVVAAVPEAHDRTRSPGADVTTPGTVAIDGIGPGTLMIQGGGSTPDELMPFFFQRIGREKARLVIIPTASADAEKPAGWKERWQKLGISDITLLHTRDRQTASKPDFVQPLREATGVWIAGGDQQRLADAYVGTLVEQELQALLRRGGVIWGTSAGAAIMSKLMIAGGNPPEAILSRGLDLLPGAVIDQHFLVRKREPRLLHVLNDHPGFVGIGVDEATALVVHGRTMRVLGSSTVSILLAAGSERPLRRMVMDKKTPGDYTTLRKAALNRASAPFPPKTVRTPEVPQGSLLIVGGGGMPVEVVNRYIELAGGKHKTFVVLPTSMPDPIPPNTGSFLRRAGVENVHVLTGRTREEVTKPEVLELLDKADAVWFDGGRQWRFVDAYEGTPFVEKLHGVLKRGGVIGGSSAGATIQGEYLCRGNPLGPNDIICEGYERGFSFLPGVGIDQHFTQRKRFKDMLHFKQTYPQYLGIGIDEATALVVRGNTAEIIGRTRACFYTGTPKDEMDFISVQAGEKIDLQTLKKVAK